MVLRSNLFKGSRGLAACEINDAAHFTFGKQGDDVGLIQMALFAIDPLAIDRQELPSKTYGQSTAAAVLAFKSKRKIINHSYQNKPDNIVGKMTIAALDREMSFWERPIASPAIAPMLSVPLRRAFTPNSTSPGHRPRSPRPSPKLTNTPSASTARLPRKPPSKTATR